MALVVGNEACTSGLSKRIYDKKKDRMEANDAYNNLDEDQKDEILESVKLDSYDVALSVIDEVTENAEVQDVTTSVASGIPCSVAPPAYTGTTTAAGSGTQDNSGTIS